jgi:uncharacterized protein with HEPN domain
MSRDDAVRIQHMIDAIEAAVRFAQGRSRSDLDRDEMLLFALVRAAEIVGEAAGKLSGEGRAQMPQVPWSAVIGMRNRLVHAYFDIDRDILWTTVTEAMPSLLAQLKPT